MSKPEKNENLMSINTIVSCLSLKAGDNDTNVLEFLNNLLISDLNTIKLNHLQLSALCNSKGRIIATFWIYIINPSEILLFCAQNMQETLTQFFNARKFRLKINIQPLSKLLAINLQSNTLHFVDETDNSTQAASNEDFYIFMINHELPWIDLENTEKFIPQHVNLDLHKNVMSFTKGCYPGQEIIARIKYLGKIKKRMVTIQNSLKNNLIEETNELEKVSPIIHNEVNKIYIIQVLKHTN